MTDVFTGIFQSVFKQFDCLVAAKLAQGFDGLTADVFVFVP